LKLWWISAVLHGGALALSIVAIVEILRWPDILLSVNSAGIPRWAILGTAAVLAVSSLAAWSRAPTMSVLAALWALSGAAFFAPAYRSAGFEFVALRPILAVWTAIVALQFAWAWRTAPRRLRQVGLAALAAAVLVIVALAIGRDGLGTHLSAALVYPSLAAASIFSAIRARQLIEDS